MHVICVLREGRHNLYVFFVLMNCSAFIQRPPMTMYIRPIPLVFSRVLILILPLPSVSYSVCNHLTQFADVLQHSSKQNFLNTSCLFSYICISLPSTEKTLYSLLVFSVYFKQALLSTSVLRNLPGAGHFHLAKCIGQFQSLSYWSLQQYVMQLTTFSSLKNVLVELLQPDNILTWLKNQNDVKTHTGKSLHHFVPVQKHQLSKNKPLLLFFFLYFSVFFYTDISKTKYLSLFFLLLPHR